MSEGNEISRRYKGPGDGTPYVPSWLSGDPVCNCGGEPHGKHCALVLNGVVEYENHASHFDEDRQFLLSELQAAQDHLAKLAGAIVRADHSLAHLMYQTGMQIKMLIERLQK